MLRNIFGGLLLIFLTGCVSTSYTKTVATELNGQGQVLKTTVTEVVHQPNRAEAPMKGEFLKGL